MTEISKDDETGLELVDGKAQVPQRPRNPVTPVEYVTYIVDYYAILDLEEGADETRIGKALTKMRAENHPDRVATMSAEIRAVAERNMRLASDIEEALIGSKREFYHERLAYFRENKPRYVSKTGAAILNFDMEYVAPDLLSSGAEVNIEALSARANEFVGFDEEDLETLRDLHEAQPNNVKIKKLYREQLGKKFLYLNELERLLWANAGVINARDSQSTTVMNYADQYEDVVANRIANISDREIPEALELRSQAMLAGAAEPLMLPSSTDDSETPLETGVIAERVRVRILETFLSRAEKLKEVASEKQATLDELIKFTESECTREGASGRCVVVMKDQGKAMIYLQGNGKQAEILEIDRMDLSEFMALDEFQNDQIIAVNHNENIGGPQTYIMEALHVLNRHFEKITS